MPFVLEVVRCARELDASATKRTRLEHVGYMRARFRTREDAASYYARHNPHMRALSAAGAWRSDWDPHTRLMFIVREDHLLHASVAPFDPRDEPVVRRTDAGACIEFRWLR